MARIIIAVVYIAAILVIGILAAAALMLSACGTEGGTQPETGASSSTEQNTQDKKTNDKTAPGSAQVLLWAVPVCVMRTVFLVFIWLSA